MGGSATLTHGAVLVLGPLPHDPAASSAETSSSSSAVIKRPSRARRRQRARRSGAHATAVRTVTIGTSTPKARSRRAPRSVAIARMANGSVDGLDVSCSGRACWGEVPVEPVEGAGVVQQAGAGFAVVRCAVGWQ